MEAMEIYDDRVELAPTGVRVLIVDNETPVRKRSNRRIAILHAKAKSDIGGKVQIAVLSAIHIQFPRVEAARRLRTLQSVR